MKPILKTISILLLIGACSCASRQPSLETSDFLSDSLNHPKKIAATEIQSRYWASGNFLVHFISNVNEQNKNLTPVIYIHGLGGSLDGFAELIKAIHPGKSSRPYYALDLPPFGRSVLKGPELSMHDYTEMLREFVSMLSVAKVSLVCHSMGGQVCIDFALVHPDKIQLLTLISPAGVYDKSAFVSGAVSYFAGINIGDVDYPHASTIANMSWYNQDLTRRLITNNPVTLIAIESFRENFRTRIGDLKTKTLILWGREDKIFSYENGLFLKENVENSILYVIDGAEHSPFESHAALLANLIQKYL